MPLEESLATAQGDSPNKKRIQIEDLIRHVFVLCGAEAPQGRVFRGNMARQLSDACPKAVKGREGRRWRWQTTRAVAKAAGKVEGQATMCLGASNNKKRTRIGADHVFVQCNPKIRLMHGLVVSRVFVS